MSDEPKCITERAAIQREREAYVSGMIRGSAREFVKTVDVRRAADVAFPLPSVRRPRVVADPHITNVDWSIRDGLLRFRFKLIATVGWGTSENWGRGVTEARINMWNDLRANPTELVSDDREPE